MDNRSLAIKQDAAQWRYFRECLERTLGGPAMAMRWSKPQLIQYKFEIEEKLRRAYLRGGRRFEFIFRLVSRRDAARHYQLDDNYPETGGYYLLVRDRRLSADLDPTLESAAATRAYIEMVVQSALDSLFAAFKALPEIDDTEFLRWHTKDGPAHRDTMNILVNHAKRGWIITNPLNPSTKQLLKIKLIELGNGKAVVRTTEYQFLRWWSTVEGKYVYPYRETNIHTYYLSQYGDKWLVDQNIEPPPLSSTPHRK